MPDSLTEAKWYEKRPDNLVVCRLCPFHCRIEDGNRGNCGVRKNENGTLYAITYGEVSSMAVDPIEKKPLYHFHPGSPILSIGEWGCNLKCSYCQNSSISQNEAPTQTLTPRDLAKRYREHGSIGVAYTYNEPLVSYEYVFDCATAVRAAGGKNVLVTNGYIDPEPLDKLLPLIDAMNIDIKGFNESFYRRLCKATLEPVLKTVVAACKKTHVELTTLLIPDTNDAVPELEDLASWIADNCGRRTPVHLTAYFPSYQMRQTATTAQHLVHARGIFKKCLDYVYTGNVHTPGGADTVCVNCSNVVITRHAFTIALIGMNANGTCANCGTDNNIVV